MARKIAFVNEKGGSGKTTLSVNIAAYFAIFKKKKVLICDLDPQGQVGKSLGFDVKNEKGTITDLLLYSDVRPESVIKPSGIEGLDVIIANKSLTNFPIDIAADRNRNRKLKQQIDKLTGYDFIIFDSPPSLGIITINIMIAADEIVIPVNMTYFALDGCAEIVETVEMVKKNFNRKDLKISLVVPTMHRNTKLANAIYDKLKEVFDKKLSKNIIRINVKIDEAQSHGQTLWDYAPTSHGALMIEAVAREILRKG